MNIRVSPPVRRSVCLISRQRIVGRTNGSSTYLLSIAEYLKSQGFAVHYLSPSPATFGRWPAIPLRPETAAFDSIRIRGALRLGPVMVALNPALLWQAALAAIDLVLDRLRMPGPRFGKRAAYSIALPLTPADQSFLRRHAPDVADVILLDYAFLTPAIDHVGRPDAPSVVIMHDLFSERARQFDKLGCADTVATISEAEEMALLGRSDLVVAIQEEEAAAVRGALPGQAVIVAPMAAHPAPQPHPGEADTILFVGSKTAPNIDGLQWFVDEVWGRVRAARPDARLLVAGSVGLARVPAAAGISYLGIVPDLGDLYRRAGVVISPLRVGSGLKIKLIEAMSWGKAIVATPTTTAGVHHLVEDCVAVTDRAPEFTDALLRLMGDDDLRAQQAGRALEVARRRFAAESCYRGIVEFITAHVAAG